MVSGTRVVALEGVTGFRVRLECRVVRICWQTGGRIGEKEDEKSPSYLTRATGRRALAGGKVREGETPSWLRIDTR